MADDRKSGNCAIRHRNVIEIMSVKVATIKYLVMDVDGTLTDGKIYMSAQGEMFKAFDIKDGYGIHDLLPQAHIIPVILTGRESMIVQNRCRELGITHCYQGCDDKETKLMELASEFGLLPDEQGIYQEIAYIGDDIIDLSCMRRCGVIGCPADAVDKVREIAHFVSTKKGGAGAVREFIEWLVDRNKVR